MKLKMFAVAICFSLTASAFAQEVTPLDKWKIAKEIFQKQLEQAKITDIEQPKWYENYYIMLGRMPLVDEVMAKPLSAPEIAVYFDDQCRKNGESLRDLLYTADTMCNAVEMPKADISVADIYKNMLRDKKIDASVQQIIDKIIAENKLPEQVRLAAAQLVMATAAGDALRKEAFAKLTQADIERLAYLAPHYFFAQKADGESLPRYVTQGPEENTFFRAFTCPKIDECVELVFLVQKIDMMSLHRAAEVMAKAADNARESFKAAEKELAALNKNDEIIFEADSPFGKIVIAGAANNVHKIDCAVLIDLGGNDRYLNNAGGTSPAGHGAAVCFDAAGDDTYTGRDFCQGAGFGGVGVLVDLAGNDTYTARNYSQSAALVGFSFLYDGAGDDCYNADFGAQSFAIFGQSIISERAGNDTYRVNSFGQAGSSTLGVTILAEASGDDVYVSGGKYGFYGANDSSVSQGGSSGIRAWPPSSQISVYGGVSLLSEAGGNDRYLAHAFAQGGAYIFALGMHVDGSGDDIYRGGDYTQGSGCHLAAGVLVEKGGNDFYASRLHSVAYSLDCSVGALLEAGGNDIYRTGYGMGSAGKPRGIGLMAECGGDDIYDEAKDLCGNARSTYGENIHSIGLFVEMGGNDKYPIEKLKNNSKWQQDDFGYGEDFEKELPVPQSAVWEPIKVNAKDGEKINSWSVYERLGGYADIWKALPSERFSKLCKTGATANPFACKDIVDALEVMRIRRELNLTQWPDVMLLAKSENRDMQLMASRLAWLGQFRSAELTAQFGKMALSGKSDAVRSMSVMALGLSGDANALPTLKEAAEDDSWVVRRRVAIALGGLAAGNVKDLDFIKQMMKDKDFRVRTQAAKSLGMINDPAAIPVLEKALKDDSEFVRLNAARSLLLSYNDAKGMPALIELLNWSNGIMIGEGVVPALTSVSGQGFGGDYKLWSEWWKKAKKGFDVKTYVAVGIELDKIAQLEEEQKLGTAVPKIRELLKEIPEHGRAKGLLARALNQVAWDNAVKGAALAESLKMIEEATAIDSQVMFLDTLAVLEYLNGKKDEAAQTIQRAIDNSKGDDQKFYQDRLKQIQAGKLELE